MKEPGKVSSSLVRKMCTKLLIFNQQQNNKVGAFLLVFIAPFTSTNNPHPPAIPLVHFSYTFISNQGFEKQRISVRITFIDLNSNRLRNELFKFMAPIKQ